MPPKPVFRMKLLQYAIHNKFLKNLALLAGSTAVAQAIGVISSPVLTRIYSPENFGVLALYSSILGIITREMSLNLEYAIPLAKDDDEAVNVLALCFITVGIVSIVIAILVNPLATLIVGDNSLSIITPYLWLIPLGAFLSGIYNSLSIMSVRLKQYTLIGRTKISQVVMQIAGQIGIGLATKGPLGLLLGFIIGRSGGFTTLFRASWNRDRESWRKVSIKRIIELFTRYRKFPLIQVWASLVNTAGTQLFPILLNLYYGPTVAGWYYLSQKVIGIPITIIGNSAKQVYIGEVSQFLNTDPKRLLRRFVKLTSRMFLAGIIPTLLLVFFGETMFSIVFGETWRQTGRYVQVMAFSFLLKFSSESFVNLALLEKHRLSFLWNALRMCMTIGGVYWAHNAGWDAYTAIIVYTAAMVLAYLLNYVLYLLSLKKIATAYQINPLVA